LSAILDYYADNAEGFLADKVLDPEYGEAIIQI
jgi:succinate-semialdehyde dehydrogenase/glutarate-semialdehyde dehydrogenase